MKSDKYAIGLISVLGIGMGVAVVLVTGRHIDRQTVEACPPDCPDRPCEPDDGETCCPGWTHCCQTGWPYNKFCCGSNECCDRRDPADPTDDDTCCVDVDDVGYCYTPAQMRDKICCNGQPIPDDHLCCLANLPGDPDCGPAADWECCRDGCCDGIECCPDGGDCRQAGEYCCPDGTTCPIGQPCCDGTCCAIVEFCCGDGVCCDIQNEGCCGDGSAEYPYTCYDLATETCCPEGHVCGQGEICCDGQCCVPPQVCCNDTGDCSDDGDGDGVGDICDNCPDDDNGDQADDDGDDVGDVCDNCPYDWNPDQDDCDANLTGDTCDCSSEEPADDNFIFGGSEYTDSCGNRILRIRPGEDFLWYYDDGSNTTLIGKCCYCTGLNALWITLTCDERRIHSTQFLSSDDVNQGPNDEGTPGRYDWQYWTFTAVGAGGAPALYCRQTEDDDDPLPSVPPGQEDEWATAGENSPCETGCQP